MSRHTRHAQVWWKTVWPLLAGNDKITTARIYRDGYIVVRYATQLYDQRADDVTLDEVERDLT
jgi:hypothetical protein